MDEIEQIYSSDHYPNFLRYCKLHGYKRMKDLLQCRFEELPELLHISSSRMSRIKAIFVLYFKNHPEDLASARTKKKTNAPVIDDLEDRLLVVFQQNANKLIHISEITKAIGKGVKRGDIIHVLEHQKWCKIVDNTTFFYMPVA
ncbi:MAG: hypothetical protein LKJ17_07570 [Oscillospiraceae bacterium]|jgi:hypothetical protein|nr:hypothetical protein [Oscillospiraceae bacterium]